MSKILKTTFAVVLSASVAAATITVPAVANAADSSASYVNGVLNVVVDRAYSDAAAYVAKYNEDGTLKTVSLKSVSLAEGENIINNISVDEGDKIMVWDNNNAPIVSAVTVSAPEATEEPSATEEPEVLNIIRSWKFDFGSGNDVAEGYTAVTADVNYTLNTDGEYQYGFIGTNPRDHKLAGGRIDGFIQQEGQVIELASGGGTGLNDAIGSVGEDIYGNAGDKFYPVRFALNVGDEKYFRVKAYVTTLDSEKKATASLYTERKHPLYTEKTINAGETEVTEFTVRTTPVYYEKSDPKGAIADGMVNVCVLGENAALAALEIYEIDTAPVLWVLGDSTVTDGGGTLPFWPLQNYTGVGSGLTKYLPKNIAMVNEGEGGLAAGDNYHFNIVKNRIKAGDFLYMEYGHNHKNDGVAGYEGCLDKYYNACKDAGAVFIIVGPIDRHNDSQYDAVTNTWSTTLGGFSSAGKAYVDGKIAEGATDIAFVDLNQPSLDWYAELTSGGVVGGTEYQNEIKLADYYFRGAKDTSHKNVDGTHPNDAGAENLAYLFFSTADTQTYPALAPLMTRFKAGKAEEPTPVSQYILDAGWAGNSTWPAYEVPTALEYPITIKKIAANDSNIIELTAYVQGSFENYASGVIEFLDDENNVTATYITTDHIDNTTGTGMNVLTFDEGVSIPDGQNYRAYMWSCYLDKEELIPENDGGVRLSGYYEPADIEVYLLPGEDSDVDKFDYYGKTNLNGSNGWSTGGSAGINTALGEDEAGRTYTNVSVTKTGNSFFIMRPFENLSSGTGASGKYMIDVDLKYISGANVTFEFAKTIKSLSPFASDEIALFNINNTDIQVTDPETNETSKKSVSGAIMVNGTYAGALVYDSWTNVKYILDLDNGTASISVAGGTPVIVDLPDYRSYNLPPIDTFKNFVISGGKLASFELQMSNLAVAKLVSDKLPEKTVTLSSADENMGTVAFVDGGTEATAVKNTVKTIVATPADGYEFMRWTDKDGNIVSYSASYDIRMYDDYEFTAEFTVVEEDPITYLYKEDFAKLTTATLAANGWVSPNAQANTTVETDEEHGSYLKLAPGSANDRNVRGTFPANARTSENYVITFDMALTPGNGHSSDFVVFDSSASVGNNAHVTSNYILKLNNGAANSVTWKVNDTEDSVTIPKGAWVNVYIVVHPSSGTSDITIKNGETELFNKTEAVNGTGIIGGVNLLSGRYWGEMKIDNIKIYTANQISE